MKLYVKNVRVIDGISPKPLENRHVVINGTMIETVSDKPIEDFDGTVWDGTGKTLLPGLVDSHVHLSGNGLPDVLERFTDPEAVVTLRAAANARKTLEAGITMVRNVGEKAYIDVHLARSIEAKETIGPRVITCGRGISILGGHGTPVIREVCGADDARLAVREHIKAGVDQIKVIASGGVLSKGTYVGAHQMTMDELRAITDEARTHFRRTCAHAHGAQAIRNCIEAGINTIEHCSLPDEESMELMAQKGIYMIPTFASSEMILRYGKEAGIRDEVIEKSKRVDEEHKERFRQAIAKGVKVAMGTDASTPYNFNGENAMELALMVDAGMTPMDAIIASTRNGAIVCEREHVTGTIEAGKFADLLVVEGDPLTHISLLQNKTNFHLIMKEGEVVFARDRQLQE
ncbi:amidohydrolase family protein [Brevibacillus sp. B_LB10_24]|uniref:metal-dependent hydrolase family protein n=1 Tax=Brevibacillus sp. B_LB10_24 TaxID=3380645 RepID=UPI0038B78195